MVSTNKLTWNLSILEAKSISAISIRCHPRSWADEVDSESVVVRCADLGLFFCLVKLTSQSEVVPKIAAKRHDHS